MPQLILLADFNRMREDFWFNQLTPAQQEEYNRCLDGVVC